MFFKRKPTQPTEAQERAANIERLARELTYISRERESAEAGVVQARASLEVALAELDKWRASAREAEGRLSNALGPAGEDDIPF